MNDIVTVGLAVDSRDVKKGREELDKLGNQASTTEKEISGLERNVKTATLAVGAMAVAAAGLAASYAVNKTMEFNSAISDLSAITGATGEDLDFLAAKSLEFGASTTKSASEAAEAFKLVASAKPDLLGNAEALAAVTKEAIILSEAAGVSLPEAAKTLGSSLNQFNAGAEESTRFINTLAAGAKFGASEIETTSQALEKVGTVASNAGLSFEETNAAIQAMANVSLKGSEAGTGFRGVLLKLSTQTRDEFNPEIVGFTKAIQNLAAANLTTSEKTKLFGLESITAANALIKEADNLETLTGKLTDTNTAYDQAKTKVNNLAGDMKTLNSVIESQGILFGKMTDDSLRVLVQGFTDVIRAEQATKEGLQEIKTEAELLSIIIGQWADHAGNAARGVALAFEASVGTIGATARATAAILSGDFSSALQIIQDHAQSLTDDMDKMTRPEIASRFENIARKMVSSNAEVATSTEEVAKATGLSADELGYLSESAEFAEKSVKAVGNKAKETAKDMKSLDGATKEVGNSTETTKKKLDRAEQALIDYKKAGNDVLAMTWPPAGGDAAAYWQAIEAGADGAEASAISAGQAIANEIERIEALSAAKRKALQEENAALRVSGSGGPNVFGGGSGSGSITGRESRSRFPSSQRQGALYQPGGGNNIEAALSEMSTIAREQGMEAMQRAAEMVTNALRSNVQNFGIGGGSSKALEQFLAGLREIMASQGGGSSGGLTFNTTQSIPDAQVSRIVSSEIDNKRGAIWDSLVKAGSDPSLRLLR